MKRNITNKIVLIGGGGHCKIIIDAIREDHTLKITGIVDHNLLKGSSFYGYPVLGEDRDLKSIFETGTKMAFIAIGSIGSPQIRQKIAQDLEDIGFSFPIIRHPLAIVSPLTCISSGTLIGAGAIIQPGVKIGKHVIINTGAIVDHDCQIGDFCHLAPGATLSGGVHIGQGTHIGTGAIIKELVNIGDFTIIGAGSVVITNIEDRMTAFGNPCRKKMTIKPQTY